MKKGKILSSSCDARIEKLVEVAEYEKFPLKWNLPESAIDRPQISNILQYMWQDMAVFYFFAF